MTGFQRTQKIDLDTFNKIDEERSAAAAKAKAEDVPARPKTEKLPISHVPTLPHESFDAAADSHTGFTRNANEDSYCYYINHETDSMLLAVADGIGGHENGDIASNITMKLLLTAWRALQSGQRIDAPSAENFLKIQIEKINCAVYSLNSSYNSSSPMGTTVAAAILLPNAIITAHAGDSRVYRLRGKKLKQLTQDHSFVADLIKQGVIEQDDLLAHPFAHVISKSVGIQENMSPEIHTYDRIPGDIVMICTDGITLHIPDTELEIILRGSKTAAAAVKKLMSTALQKGGYDNITTVCAFDHNEK